MYVMEHYEPELVHADDDHDDQYVWIGNDDRGVELEIVAVEVPDCLLVIPVIPVMPRAFRRHR
jgi:hypothetical protein